jgi:hypothetical protein
MRTMMDLGMIKLAMEILSLQIYMMISMGNLSNGMSQVQIDYPRSEGKQYAIWTKM